MGKDLEVCVNEAEILVKSEDAELSLERSTGIVTLEDNRGVDYATFIKMVKALKRVRNRESIKEEFLDD